MMKKIFIFSFIISFGIAFSQNNNNTTQEFTKNESTNELKTYIASLILPISEQIDYRKLNIKGKNITAIAKFAFDENLVLKPNTLIVVGDNQNLNEQIAKLIKPLLLQWKPLKNTTSATPSTKWFTLPINIYYDNENSQIISGKGVSQESVLENETKEITTKETVKNKTNTQKTLQELKAYITSLIDPISEQIDETKVKGYGKKLSATTKFTVNEKLLIDPNSIVVIGENPVFNEEVLRIVKPMLAKWKPIVSNLPSEPSFFLFEFPINISFH